MEYLLKTTGLSKSYGNIDAVKSVNLEIGKGEIVGFLGPNGAGKSTTLKLLIGLLKPDRGSIEICGNDFYDDVNLAKSKIGYVPDIPAIYEKLTPLEFLRFIADVFKIDKRISAKRINDLVDLFDLGDHLKKLNSSLSHGNKQKVSLAAAVLHRPDVLLLDEPTGGLDPRATRKIKDVIKELAKSGCAILFSTHILEIAENMCDRMYIIDNGVIVAEGSIDQLRESAKSGSSLEELFIELTGGSEYSEVIKYLNE